MAYIILTHPDTWVCRRHSSCHRADIQ